ncbi:MAG: beta-ketoacyl-ACP synthase II [bacterium]|nr:beta-ketoacyl-ACP synthase II [bacterium]
MKRVVVTGMGAVTPVGIGVENYWRALLGGVSGAGAITLFDAAGFDCRIAAEVKGFDPLDHGIERKEARRMDRFVQLGMAAARMALEGSGLVIDSSNAGDTGVIVGSGIGGIGTWEEQHANLILKGPGRVSPFFVPMMISDMASGQLSIAFGAKGPNISITTACATGTNSIGEAFEIIRRGDATAMIAGGCEAAVTPMAVAGFCSMKALTGRNDDPQHASRPFDSKRDGFLIGEGAGVLILEEMKSAQARGAVILAEIIGYGSTGDAYHITAPDPQGAGACHVMQRALRKARVEPGRIDYINAHGTSTELNDKLESAAITSVFGAAAGSVAISSTKSCTGHMLGAAGAVEAIACIKTIMEGIIPPTINYENPDPECTLDYVPNKPRSAEVDMAMSNSFGFGGHNACLIFKRYED